MKRALMLVGCACLTGGSALAADLPIIEPIPVFEQPLIYDWSGFYIGVQGGYAGDFGHGDGGEDRRFDRDNWVNGFVAGGHVGYLWQFNQLVVGLEGDAEWANIDADDNDPFADPFRGFRLHATREYNFLASARLRAGWAFNRLLVYATGGWAYANADVETRFERRFGDNNDFDAFTSTSTGLHGYTVGGGVDALVTQRLSVGLEYRWTDLEDASIRGRRLVDGPEFDAGELINTFHGVRARVSYHF